MGALGDQLYIEPISNEGNIWTGKIVDRGAKALKFSTYSICDLVTYNINDIINVTSFNGKSVHIISFENIRKIEGVY